jgi:hypothetical protein
MVSSSRVVLVATICGSLLLGMGIERYLLRSKPVADPAPAPRAARAEDSRREPAPRALTVVNAGSALDANAIRAEVAHAVGEALDERATADAAQRAAAEEAKSPLPTAENIEAFVAADAVIDAAISAKRWTPEDRASLSAALRGVTRDQHRDVVLRLTRSINSGELPFTPSD